MSVNESVAKIQSKLSDWYQEYGRHRPYWNSRFDRFARIAARIAGRPVGFTAAIAIVSLWLLTGPFFGFSNTWQLFINSVTTIVTFLMVFLIQHTQNRDTEALQVKIDELIHALDGANDVLLDLEELEEEELSMLRDKYITLAREARIRQKDLTDRPD
jgi:low affinity Fe/Cu permease